MTDQSAEEACREAEREMIAAAAAESAAESPFLVHRISSSRRSAAPPEVTKAVLERMEGPSGQPGPEAGRRPAVVATRAAWRGSSRISAAAWSASPA